MPVSFGLYDPCSGVGCGPDDSGGDAVYSLHLRMGCWAELLVIEQKSSCLRRCFYTAHHYCPMGAGGSGV